jgi:hypothetical protein
MIKNFKTDFSNITTEELLELIRNTKIYFNNISWLNDIVPDKFKIEIDENTENS